MPSAILATLGGGLIDRYGVRRSLLFAAAALILGSVLVSQVHSLLALDCAMVVSGLGFAGICVGAPCLVMATLRNGARTRSMALCSTFAPTGYAAGLLLAVPFTASGDWRTAFLTHAAMMAVAFLALNAFRAERRLRDQRVAHLHAPDSRAHVSVVREPRALRLAVAIALPNAVSYGTSLAAPSYLARVHHLTIAHSSATVAFAKLAAMIIGGLSMGYLLSRQVRTSLLFAFMVATGLLAQTILFLPASSIDASDSRTHAVAVLIWRHGGWG